MPSSNRETYSIIVAIAGGTGSGKSTLSDTLASQNENRVRILRADWYYKDLAHLPLDKRNARNFDHPDSYDRKRLCEDVARLTTGRETDVPQYDFRNHMRAGCRRTKPAEFIILEGILVLSDEDIRRHTDLKVFVDTPDDIRLMRRIERDMRERGRTLESVRQQYLSTVRPMHERYIAPSRQWADIALRGDRDLAENVETLWARMLAIADEE